MGAFVGDGELLEGLCVGWRGQLLIVDLEEPFIDGIIRHENDSQADDQSNDEGNALANSESCVQLV